MCVSDKRFSKVGMGEQLCKGQGGRSQCRSAEWNGGAVVMVGGKRYSKWIQIGSYKKKHR